MKKPVKKADYKSSKYRDGRSQGAAAPLGTKRSIKDRADPAYGTPAQQAKGAAFRAAASLKSNKKAGKDVKLARKGK